MKRKLILLSIRLEKYGFQSIIHAHSLLQGGRAIARSSLVGGHAGGMSGLEGGKDETDSKKFIDYNEYRDRPFGLKWGLLLRWKN